MNDLNKISIRFLKGVGPKKEQLLNKLGVYTVLDLLEYYPKYYEDMTKISRISDFSTEKSIYKIRILSEPTVKYIRSKMNILSMLVSDGTREAELIFFNQPFLKNILRRNQEVLIQATLKSQGHRIQLTSPKIIKATEFGGLVPVYGLTKGITNKEIQTYVKNGIEKYSAEINEFLPNDILQKYNLLNYTKAISFIHFPTDFKEYTEARKRLAFNEILILQLALTKLKSKEPLINVQAAKFKAFKAEMTNYINNLPFQLTGAQNKVVTEIMTDLTTDKRMNRLLQGDVGSGKTVVASIAIYSSFLNGYQTALMVPTEILAKQHYKSLNEMMKNTGIRIGLLTGDLKPKEKELVQWQIANNSYDLVIGTHALIQEKVSFPNLGLTITDEQHRFGVQQRKNLTTKGEMPNNLVMTATPIPRTLALVLYGDMDISSIDELPPNRKSIDTIVVNESYQERLDGFILKQIDEGRQIYVVCPLIEEADSNLLSVEEVYRHYTSSKFSSVNVGYVHGKLKNNEKSEIMNDFVAGDIDILISTTVIEVGINVPNASLMIIYNADRFGLSQLHQLRGRVGRGSEKSYCILINDNLSENSYRRMKIMQNSNDGFYIAEKDLELRGQGELLGNRQHGVPEFKIINLVTDMDLIENVKIDSKELIEANYFDNKKYELLNKKVDKLVEDINLISN